MSSSLIAPPPRRGRFVLVALLLIALVGVGFAALLSGRGPAEEPGFAVPELDVEPGTAIPHGARPVTVDGVRAWADRLADVTDIPARSLVAYVTAEQQVRTTKPNCNLTWATLAGVGRVESHHGNYQGTKVGEDGTLSKPIVGVPLDGSPGLRAIKDTDGGRLDGDPEWDRAVGSMQFLPETWQRFSVRASGDGAAPDPQNVDDAALTAARYLCASGGDLGTNRGWWRAVLTYNSSNSYGRTVFSGAEAYARKADELG